MKKSLWITAIFLVWIGSRCTNDGMSIGDNWVDPHTRLVFIDTCTVELSSVLLDSVPTSGGDRIFSGIYRSELWGETTVSSFITFSKATDFSNQDNQGVKEYIRFDSLTLWMVPDSMFCGDTTRLMTYELYRLTEQVELDENGYLYGHSRFAHEPQPFASKSFYPRPWRGREVEIRLPDELGREFLDKLAERDTDMENDENFRKYFNGIVLSPGRDSEALLGFKASDSTSMMKLYYHTFGSNRTEHVAEFKLMSNNLFNRIESDRSNAPLEGISFKDNEIRSAKSGNMAFVEGLTGIYTKIEFPYLNRIQELGSHGTVVSASLVVYPLAGSYGRQNYSPIPEVLQMYVSSETNITTGAITDSNDELQSGSLTYDDQFSEKTCYTYDVTDFIKGQLGMIGINKRNLQMIGENYGYTLNSLVLANQTDERKNIELQIIYAIYDDQ